MTTTPSPELPDLDRDLIREVFLRNGFTVKEGQTDLKLYVYEAAAELIALARRAQPEGEAPQAEARIVTYVPSRAKKGVLKITAYGPPDMELPPHREILSDRLMYPAARHAESGAIAAKAEALAADDDLTDDDKRLVARGMERWRKGIAGECRLPPVGWHCTRADGHDGPCAAHPVVAQSQGAQANDHVDAAVLRKMLEEMDVSPSKVAELRAALAAKAEVPAVVFANDGREPDWQGYAEAERAQQAAAPGTMDDLLPTLGIRNDRDMLNYLMTAFDNEIANCERCGHAEPTKNMDSASFLRDYLAAAPSAPGTPEAPAKLPRLYRFDCYVGKTKMAAGVGVHATSMEEAEQKARKLADKDETIEFESNRPCHATRKCGICAAYERAAQLDGGQGEGEKS